MYDSTYWEGDDLRNTPRKLAGLTQAELAERIDKSTAFLGQVEAPGIVCGVSLETLFKIAREVGVSPAKLLEEDE